MKHSTYIHNYQEEGDDDEKKKYSSTKSDINDSIASWSSAGEP